MKYILFICVLFMAAADAAVIGSYEELTTAMRAGARVMIEVDLGACMQNENMPVGYFSPSSMMIVPGAKEHVVTSDLHFTDTSGRPAYEYVKYTFNSDGSVVVQVTALDPQSFKALAKPHTIICSLGSGVQVHVADS